MSEENKLNEENIKKYLEELTKLSHKYGIYIEGIYYGLTLGEIYDPNGKYKFLGLDVPEYDPEVSFEQDYNLIFNKK